MQRLSHLIVFAYCPRATTSINSDCQLSRMAKIGRNASTDFQWHGRSGVVKMCWAIMGGQ